MLINETKVIKIFIDVDDFCKAHNSWTQKNGLPDSEISLSRPGPKRHMHTSEIMTIQILYHLSGFKCFEYFYNDAILGTLRTFFPKALSYGRFIALIPETGTLMFMFDQWLAANNQRNGIYVVDSKKLEVCHLRRGGQNKVFKGIANKGKSSMGWFFGLKLHLVINEHGQMVNFLLTSARIADNNKDVLNHLFDDLKGKCIGDKGYLTKLFESFLEKGLQIITKIRKNMKNVPIKLSDKLLLRKRGVIESVNDILISICDIEHSRHRSAQNAFISIFAGLAAYDYLDRKPSIKLNEVLMNS